MDEDLTTYDILKPYHIQKQEDRETHKNTVDSMVLLLKGKTYRDAQKIIGLLKERLIHTMVI